MIVWGISLAEYCHYGVVLVYKCAYSSDEKIPSAFRLFFACDDNDPGSVSSLDKDGCIVKRRMVTYSYICSLYKDGIYIYI
jgi:hypothetical protein